MRAVLTLAGKDLRNLLTNPLYYLIAGLCTIVWSFTYMRGLLQFAQRSVAMNQPGMETGLSLQREVFLPHISYVHLLFVFMVPALTMRLLAEEKRLRTYDLLLTSPVTATQIALGKFLGGLGAVGVLILISFFYPLATRLVGAYPFVPLLSAYLGLLLVSAVYVAVGLFASALTESIMLSVIMALIFNLILWFVSQGLGEQSGAFGAVMEYMGLGQHFSGFIMGAIKLNSLVFMASVIGLFIFLTQRVVESSRWR
jgi:ABC-2 type transport system permease protein